MRKILDRWDFAHFLGGSVLAFILYMFGISFLMSLSIFLFIAIFWEIIEKKFDKFVYEKNINELFFNKILDIIFGTLGFLFVWALINFS